MTNIQKEAYLKAVQGDAKDLIENCDPALKSDKTPEELEEMFGGEDSGCASGHDWGRPVNDIFFRSYRVCQSCGARVYV